MKIQFRSEYEEPTFIYNHCLKTDQKQQDYQPHYHDMYEIIFLKEGDISYLTEEGAHPVRKHSLIFTRPQQRHCIRIDKNTLYDRYDILFDAQELNAGIAEILPKNQYIFNFDANPIVIQLFDKMDLYYDKLEGEHLGQVIRNLLQEVLMNLYMQANEVSSNAPAVKQPLTLAAIAYIEENLLSLSGVDPICRELGVSRSYLYQLFQADLRTTPKRFIMERRLNLARQEIFLGAKATSVYTQCGFSDYSTFFRAYKKHFGYPPTGTHHASIVRSANEDIFKGYLE